MLIAGGAVGSLGLLIKIWVTAAGARARPDPNVSAVQVVGLGSVYYTPFIATGMGLLGGAMGRRGHADAHGELFEHRTPSRKRRTILGWSLFGAGLSVWAGTRLGVNRCASETCAFRTLEWGYYLSLVGTVPGIVMGSYGTGFARYKRKHGHLADLSVSPLVHRDVRGLSISARF